MQHGTKTAKHCDEHMRKKEEKNMLHFGLNFAPTTVAKVVFLVVAINLKIESKFIPSHRGIDWHEC